MVTLGLDIGTTTISAVAVEEGRVLAAETLPNDAALPGEDWERKQDPRRILLLARQAVERLLARFPQTAARHRLSGQRRSAGQPPVHMAGSAGPPADAGGRHLCSATADADRVQRACGIRHGDPFL